MSNALALVGLIVGGVGVWRYRRELFERNDAQTCRQYDRQRRALGRAATAQRDD